MKRTLVLLAAALVAAPFTYAMADDAAPAADAAAAAATDAAGMTATDSYNVTLKDGTVVSIEGDKAFVADADGNKTPAPDGDHELADGTTMTVSAGVITAGKPAAPAAGETPADGGEAQPE